VGNRIVFPGQPTQLCRKDAGAAISGSLFSSDFFRMRRNFRTALVVGVGLMLMGCAGTAPPQPPTLNLPKPPGDLRAVRKGEHVELTWTIPTETTDRRGIRTVGVTEICRGGEARLTECGKPVGNAAAERVSAPAKSNKPSQKKETESYMDTLPNSALSENPKAFVMYAVEPLNENNRGAGLSNQVQVLTIRTPDPPRDFSARVTAQGVVLSWTPTSGAGSADVHYSDRIYRQQLGSAQATVVGSVPVTGQSAATLTDGNIEWEKTYEYWAETVTVIAEPGRPEVEVAGDDTAKLKVFANDVFPPAAPTGLQAGFSGPGQQPFVDLIWAPVAAVDLDGYNVYRREEGVGWTKLNAEPVRVPAYRDTNVVAGSTYFYSVSAVDVRGNESARSEETSERVP
jgi:hypothetical protein